MNGDLITSVSLSPFSGWRAWIALSCTFWQGSKCRCRLPAFGCALQKGWEINGLCR